MARPLRLEYGGAVYHVLALLTLGFVVAVVIARYGGAPATPPRSRPKSPVAEPFPIFRHTEVFRQIGLIPAG